MATLIQAYEQQYSVLTAEITSKIGRLKVGNQDDCDYELVKEIDANFEEANDLLEQLDLECHGFGANAAAARAAAYRAELQRMRNQCTSLGAVPYDHYTEDTEELYEDWSSNDQHQTLLSHHQSTNNQQSKARRALQEGYRIALQTETIGTHVLQDLNGQRETIHRARERLRESEDAVSRSTRVINAMVSRALQQRLAMMAIVFATGVIICASLYLYLT